MSLIDRNLAINEFTSKEIKDQIEYISFIVETDLRQAVSPDNWFVYSDLHDEI